MMFRFFDLSVSLALQCSNWDFPRSYADGLATAFALSANTAISPLTARSSHRRKAPQTRPSALGRSRAEAYLAVSALLLMILTITTTALRVLAISSGATLAYIRNVPRTLSRRCPIQPAVRRAAAR